VKRPSDEEEPMQQLSMDELNKITEAIIGAAMEVHKHGGIKRLAN
jgi:hypothetical protein